jgi:sugar O-acyltransferase (sialic acid O-acetyltransferase NeuD family)
MKNLLIIGARAFGREVYNITIQTKEYNSEWVVKGFLDDDPTALKDFYKSYPPIIGSVKDYKIQKDDVFICALGDPIIKKNFIQEIELRGGKFINIIHPTAIINPTGVKLGKGIIICPLTYISNDVTIKNFVTIQTHVAVGHDSIIEEYCQINAFTFIGGFTHIKDNTLINPGACIAPKVSIGKEAIVGINSGVISNVKDNTSVYGNPAKRIL